MAQQVNPVKQIAMVAATDPKETSSEDYQPITDPQNTKRFIENYFSDIPVLQKIAFCESTYRQFNKDGSVRRGKSNNSDVGVMQINELYHGKEASALGIDLEDTDGNVAYARHLYEREGTKPWNSSSQCWNKSEDLAINSSAKTDKN